MVFLGVPSLIRHLFFRDKERNHRFGILQDEGCSRTFASFLYSKFAAQGSIGVFLARENARKCGERSAKGVDSCFFGVASEREQHYRTFEFSI